jgi:two-component system chemotaxis response regulator CheB
VEPRAAERGAPARVVGIGASAGGVDALMRVLRNLPADVQLAILVVLHVPASGRSLLAGILARHTDLDVVEAQDGAQLVAGRVYVAPNDRHLLVGDGHLRLDRGPKENGVRPAVDPMLRSLASAYGRRAVAVILSGALRDGSNGVVAVRNAGGAVIVQDPDDAAMPSMPESALRAVGRPDAVLEAGAIGEVLETMAAARPMREDAAVSSAAEPYSFTCPECNGSLWESVDGEGKDGENGGVLHFECRVEHKYTFETLLAAKAQEVEASVWAAVNALEERAGLLRKSATRAQTRWAVQAAGENVVARLLEQARESEEHAELIRRTLLGALAAVGSVETADPAVESDAGSVRA